MSNEKRDIEMTSKSHENLQEIDYDESYGDDDEDEWDNDIDYCDELPGTSYADPLTPAAATDPEYFDYRCLTKTDVETLFNVAVQDVCSLIPVSPSIAKVLLNRNHWDASKIGDAYRSNCHQLLVDSGLKPKEPVSTQMPKSSSCPVCCRIGLSPTEMKGLACGHSFCLVCWLSHCRMQLLNGVSTGIACMEPDCYILAPEDFILTLLNTVKDLRMKYLSFTFRDYVTSHPHLKMCIGVDCPTIIEGKTKFGKRVECKLCGSSFCFLCGQDYHAPADCETIKKWLIKCADDSETANYISAHTKDCPQCHSCIEKNGGCNHMQCTKCKHHFCWMCLGDWKTHGSEYYECSRYKENPTISNEVANAKARRALEKYLHYYERWENHNKSLQLEQQLKEKIRKRIDEKVNKHEGTWIDWQYLYDAASLLTKCRYTLQYTYPFAFFMPSGSRRDLFEYQQAQLEKEIEELSWKVERAETTDRGDLEAQMHVARRKRLTLLQDFFDENAANQWASVEHAQQLAAYAATLNAASAKGLSLEKSNLTALGINSASIKASSKSSTVNKSK